MLPWKGGDVALEIQIDRNIDHYHNQRCASDQVIKESQLRWA